MDSPIPIPDRKSLILSQLGKSPPFIGKTQENDQWKHFASITLGLRKSALLYFQMCDLGRGLKSQKIGLKESENSEILFLIWQL